MFLAGSPLPVLLAATPRVAAAAHDQHPAAAAADAGDLRERAPSRSGSPAGAVTLPAGSLAWHAREPAAEPLHWGEVDIAGDRNVDTGGAGDDDVLVMLPAGGRRTMRRREEAGTRGAAVPVAWGTPGAVEPARAKAVRCRRGRGKEEREEGKEIGEGSLPWSMAERNAEGGGREGSRVARDNGQKLDIYLRTVAYGTRASHQRPLSRSCCRKGRRGGG